MIEIRGLYAGYPRKEVLRGAELRAEDGKVTALIGPNGCGKSTLLKTVAGIVPAGAGEAAVDGDIVSALAPRRLAQQVSYMPQLRVAPKITARRMVLYGRFPYLSYPRRYSAGDWEAVERSLARAGAESYAGCLMTRLSGGQQQKVYFAMTLAQDTKNVLLDEPTSFLDLRHQLELLRIARELASAGKAVLLVMHDVRLAMQYADEIAVMADGRVLLQGTPGEVFSSAAIDRVFGVRLGRVNTETGYQYYYESVTE